MFKKFYLALAALVLFSVPAWSTTYTPCTRTSLPVPNDPAVANIWGTILNTNFSLIDTTFGGGIGISVAGNTNVVLTGANGAVDQTRNQFFTFTGTLTGNINVLFAATRCGVATVKNSTSGAFTLSMGVDDGAGSPAGTTVTIPQGMTAQVYYNGGNVVATSAPPPISGPWTPTDSGGGGLTFTSTNCRYTRIGNFLFIYGSVQYPVTADTHPAQWSGVPFTWLTSFALPDGTARVNTINAPMFIAPNAGTTLAIAQYNGGVTNSQLSGATVQFSVAFEVQ